MRSKFVPSNFVKRHIETTCLVVALAVQVCHGQNSAPTTPPQTEGTSMRVLGTRPPDTVPAPGKAWETRPKIVPDQKPAFDKQTRVGAVFTKTNFEEQVIAHNLNHPWAVAFLPDGRFLITEKTGSLIIVEKDGTKGKPIAGLPQVLYGGDSGLLDVKLDPNFPKNRRIYFSYVEPRDTGVALLGAVPGGGPILSGTGHLIEPTPNAPIPAPPVEEQRSTSSFSRRRPAGFNANGLTVASARLSDDGKSLEDVNAILRTETGGGTSHLGGRMLFAPDGTLFVSTSEHFGDQTRIKAQDIDSLLGKVLRINTDGSAVATNPFYNVVGARREIWTLGNRNPQGLTFNPATGDLWDSEFGPQAGDEVNVLKPGHNYGWPVVAYGMEYYNAYINNKKTEQIGMDQPVYYWDPTVGPSGTTFYTGSVMPEWKGNLFLATHAGQHLIRLVIRDNKVIGEERLLLGQHQGLRDVEQGPDGALWVLTDDADGRLLRLAPHGK